jgi:hypothetical protein
MPTPLSDSVSDVLRANCTADLTALMVIANAHREVCNWAARMIGAEPPAKTEEPKPNDVAKQPKKRAKGDFTRNTRASRSQAGAAGACQQTSAGRRAEARAHNGAGAA